MVTAAAEWVTWAAWADIDSLKLEEPIKQNAAGRNSGRVFLRANKIHLMAGFRKRIKLFFVSW
jgi:hypothetical protein